MKGLILPDVCVPTMTKTTKGGHSKRLNSCSTLLTFVRFQLLCKGKITQMLSLRFNVTELKALMCIAAVCVVCKQQVSSTHKKIQNQSVCMLLSLVVAACLLEVRSNTIVLKLEAFK